MMQPKFDGVFEYVKAGEIDPDMKKMLSFHPDGPELLKQARFICRMLQRRFESADDAVGGFDQMQMMDSLEAESTQTFYQSAPRRLRAKRSLSINRLIDEDSVAEDLGTLSIATEADRHTLVYDPSEAAEGRLRKRRGPKLAAAQMDFLGIVIYGRGYMVSMPDAIAVGEPIAIQVTQNISKRSARRLALIYMPDSGPFVRIETDREGRAEWQMPEQPGTLRINSGIPQLLHVKLTKK